MSESPSTSLAPLPAAIAPVPARAELSGGPWPGLPAWRSDEPESPLTLANLSHALRRRWLWAVVLGVPAAAFTATLLWIFVPLRYEAASQVRVRAREDRILPVASATDRMRLLGEDFDIFRNTQIDLIKNPRVIYAALRKPGIANLPMLPAENAVGYLEQRLSAKYPNNAEVLSISLAGEDPEQLIKLVDAVTDAYLEEEVYKRRENLRRRKLDLENRQTREREDLRQRREELHRIKTQVGAQDSLQARLRHKLELEKLAKLDEQQADLSSRLHEVELKIALLQTADANREETELPDYLVEEQLEKDSQYLRLKEEFDAAQQQYSSIAAAARPSAVSVQRAAAAMELVGRQLAGRRRQLARRIEEKLRAELEETAHGPQTLSLLETERQIVSQRLATVNQSHDDQLKLVRDLDDFNAVHDIKQQDLDHLVERDRIMQAEIQDLNDKLESPERIEKIQSATILASNSRMIKYLQVFGGGLLAGGLILAGLAVADALGRRVNSAGDLSAASGIPVLGTLPALAGTWPRWRLSPSAMSAVVGEAVDSIRTALMRPAANGSPRRVIMITSSGGGEGKTVLASHLAISFARAGRSTLLIDGDTRNPQQHEVFGLSGHRGLCDALRGGIEAADFIQSTPYENLSLLPSGFADGTSLRAMASPSLRATLQELLASYEYLVIDAAPVLTSTEPLLLGQLADAVVLSVRRDVSRLPKLDDTRQRLRAVAVDITGAVVHGAAPELRRQAAMNNGQTRESEADV
jgi:capsular exopolysaccharide synthesis family protein